MIIQEAYDTHRAPAPKPNQMTLLEETLMIPNGDAFIDAGRAIHQQATLMSINANAAST